VFDDFSFALTGRSEKDRERLNKIFKIRHYTKSNDLILIFIVHYVRSLAVFLRASQVRILTSVTEPEIRLYSSEYLFTPSALWDYLYHYSSSKNRYLILYNGVRSGEHIVDVTLRDQ